MLNVRAGAETDHSTVETPGAETPLCPSRRAFMRLPQARLRTPQIRGDTDACT